MYGSRFMMMVAMPPKVLLAHTKSVENKHYCLALLSFLLFLPSFSFITHKKSMKLKQTFCKSKKCKSNLVL